MTIEADPTASTVYIDDLNATYPTGSDVKKEGDNHLRLVKKVLKNTFPNVDGAVTPTEDRLNLLTPAYLALAGTTATVGYTPLRLAVSDAVANAECSIQFQTQNYDKRFGLVHDATALDMFRVTSKLRVTDPADGVNWYDMGLSVYAVSGIPGIGLHGHTYGGGIHIEQSGGFCVIANATGTAYNNLIANKIIGQHVSAGLGVYNAGLLSYNPSGTPRVGILGGAYGATIRINQSNGRFEFTTADESGYQVVACQALVEVSDAREKEDLAPISGAVDKVLGLAGYTFTRKATGAPGAGVLAQDLLEVLPEAVSDDGSRYSVEYAGVTGLLVEAVKELACRLAVADARITKLERGVR